MQRKRRRQVNVPPLPVYYIGTIVFIEFLLFVSFFLLKLTVYTFFEFSFGSFLLCYFLSFVGVSIWKGVTPPYFKYATLQINNLVRYYDVV